MADAGGGGEGFADLLLKEVNDEGLECGSVQMLVEMAKSGDSDTVADALSYLVEAGAPDKAAGCLRKIMGGSATPAPAPAPGGPKPPPLDYAAAAKVLNRLVELGWRPPDVLAAGHAVPRCPGLALHKTSQAPRGGERAPLAELVELGSLTEAQELLKFMLVARETDRGRGKMLDCYDVSLILGAMVPEDAADSAGKLLYALYSTEGGDDAAASQTLVPFILGTLLDHDRVAWAVELGKQLMYTTLEEIEAGGGEYDYSVLGWCLAQMVWYGRADWSARLCADLERQNLEWYSTQDMLHAVAGWGDPSYSMTIENFMRDMRRKEGGPGPGPSGPPGPYGGGGGGPYRGPHFRG
ncbi:hypothetical protein HYH03_000150 [Edaphochlamys debaryana]|uniref:Uncharacterized protein n=1 Tax=Edaphochlamys debaryana TaxID=47281 RepID=A0A835YFL1_9CHLO|nr:hypothetical protein HYH03_000150 [Edaphochlamys debaryana]|eukprot:KAG2501646.1 hypothetical protein HYH03_000150 [Edaphochlamys debaryana]